MAQATFLRSRHRVQVHYQATAVIRIEQSLPAGWHEIDSHYGDAPDGAFALTCDDGFIRVVSSHPPFAVLAEFPTRNRDVVSFCHIQKTNSFVTLEKVDSPNSKLSYSAIVYENWWHHTFASIDCSIIPRDLSRNASGEVVVAFLTHRGVPAGGTVHVRFPEEFRVKSTSCRIELASPELACPDMEVSLLDGGRGRTTVVIACQNRAVPIQPGFIRLILSDITNPRKAGRTSPFDVKVCDSRGGVIDQHLTVPGIEIASDNQAAPTQKRPSDIARRVQSFVLPCSSKDHSNTFWTCIAACGYSARVVCGKGTTISLWDCSHEARTTELNPGDADKASLNSSPFIHERPIEILRIDVPFTVSQLSLSGPVLACSSFHEARVMYLKVDRMERGGVSDGGELFSDGKPSEPAAQDEDGAQDFSLNPLFRNEFHLELENAAGSAVEATQDLSAPEGPHRKLTHRILSKVGSARGAPDSLKRSHLTVPKDERRASSSASSSVASIHTDESFASAMFRRTPATRSVVLDRNIDFIVDDSGKPSVPYQTNSSVLHVPALMAELGQNGRRIGRFPSMSALSAISTDSSSSSSTQIVLGESADERPFTVSGHVIDATQRITLAQPAAKDEGDDDEEDDEQASSRTRWSSFDVSHFEQRLSRRSSAAATKSQAVARHRASLLMQANSQSRSRTDLRRRPPPPPTPPPPGSRPRPQHRSASLLHSTTSRTFSASPPLDSKHAHATSHVHRSVETRDLIASSTAAATDRERGSVSSSSRDEGDDVLYRVSRCTLLFHRRFVKEREQIVHVALIPSPGSHVESPSESKRSLDFGSVSHNSPKSLRLLISTTMHGFLYDLNHSKFLARYSYSAEFVGVAVSESLLYFLTTEGIEAHSMWRLHNIDPNSRGSDSNPPIRVWGHRLSESWAIAVVKEHVIVLSEFASNDPLSPHANGKTVASSDFELRFSTSESGYPPTSKSPSKAIPPSVASGRFDILRRASLSTIVSGLLDAARALAASSFELSRHLLIESLSMLQNELQKASRWDRMDTSKIRSRVPVRFLSRHAWDDDAFGIDFLRHGGAAFSFFSTGGLRHSDSGLSLAPPQRDIFFVRRKVTETLVGSCYAALGDLYFHAGKMVSSSSFFSRSNRSPIEVVELLQSVPRSEVHVTTYLSSILYSNRSDIAAWVHRDPALTELALDHFQTCQPHQLSSVLIETCLFSSNYDRLKVLRCLEEVCGRSHDASTSGQNRDESGEDAMSPFSALPMDLFACAVIHLEPASQDGSLAEDGDDHTKTAEKLISQIEPSLLEMILEENLKILTKWRHAFTLMRVLWDQCPWTMLSLFTTMFSQRRSLGRVSDLFWQSFLSLQESGTVESFVCQPWDVCVLTQCLETLSSHGGQEHQSSNMVVLFLESCVSELRTSSKDFSREYQDSIMKLAAHLLDCVLQQTLPPDVGDEASVDLRMRKRRGAEVVWNTNHAFPFSEEARPQWLRSLTPKSAHNLTSTRGDKSSSVSQGSFSSAEDVAELPPAFEQDSQPYVKRSPQRELSLSPLVKLQSILHDQSVKDSPEFSKTISASLHDTLAQGGFAETVETDTILLTILPGMNRLDEALDILLRKYPNSEATLGFVKHHCPLTASGPSLAQEHSGEAHFANSSRRGWSSFLSKLLRMCSSSSPRASDDADSEKVDKPSPVLPATGLPDSRAVAADGNESTVYFLRDVYIRLYSSTLEFLVSQLSLEDFLELLPSEGNAMFFLPLIERAFRLNASHAQRSIVDEKVTVLEELEASLPIA